MVPKELEESTLKLMDEAKTDTNVQKELRDMVMDITGTVSTLWIPKRLALVQVGHTPFKYMSKARDKDPYHRHTIIFMGDRDESGDPTPFAMSPDKAKECGIGRRSIGIKRSNRRPHSSMTRKICTSSTHPAQTQP